MKTKHFSVSIASSLQPPVLDEYIRDCVDHVAKQIDYETMADILVESGWHRVKLEKTLATADDLFNWVYNDQNIKGHAHGFEKDWVFELESDANWFVLRWLV
jgi:hypothetical protein